MIQGAMLPLVTMTANRQQIHDQGCWKDNYPFGQADQLWMFQWYSSNYVNSNAKSPLFTIMESNDKQSLRNFLMVCKGSIELVAGYTVHWELKIWSCDTKVEQIIRETLIHSQAGAHADSKAKRERKQFIQKDVKERQRDKLYATNPDPPVTHTVL